MKLLRKELKVKDDKIYRLKEHADLMAAHMDRLKGEVARLNAKLHQAEQELEAKESRLVEALKSRKKVSKKTNKESQSNGGGGETIAALEAENARLREREAALMDAVRLSTVLLLFSRKIGLMSTAIIYFMYCFFRWKSFQYKMQILFSSYVSPCKGN